MPAEKDVPAQVRKNKAAIRKNAVKAVAKAMTKLKEQLGLQETVAKVTGIPQSAVSQTMKGKRLPEADTLILMAQMLHRSVDSILGLVDGSQSQHGPALDMLLAMADVEGRRALYNRLHEEFGTSSETQAEVEAATAATRPQLPPTSPTPAPDSRSQRQSREK